MIEIAVQGGDALTVAADVLAVKYAQDFYGLAEEVARVLEASGVSLPDRLPKPSESILIESQGAVGAKRVLVIGTVPLHQFGYEEIRRFGRQVLSALMRHGAEVQHIALTVQGINLGLDGAEAFKSEIAGFLDAVSEGSYPRSLSQISVIERRFARCAGFQEVLNGILPRGFIPQGSVGTAEYRDEEITDQLRSVGYGSDTKPHVFVAMPFSSEMDDVYHYGIQGAVRAAGYLCERADSSSFTADVMEWVRKRIASASLVVADLSGANPNVYLEVGYAWGCGRPTVLLVNNVENLKFDVRGYRCLVYKNIKNLEELLCKELEQLKKKLNPNR